MISVCMATYNGEQFIKQQIYSILKQLEQNDEIVVSDNYSNDSTVNILKDFRDDRIKIYYFRQKSIVLNFENALKKAKGDYIFLADQDDVWENDKVICQLQDLKKYDLSMSNMSIINSKDEVTNPDYFSKKKPSAKLSKNIISNTFVGCSLAFNKKILNLVLPFPNNIPMHDWWIGVIAIKYGKIFFNKKTLLRYRRHDNNSSSTAQNSTNSIEIKFKWRVIMLNSLIKRYFLKK